MPVQKNFKQILISAILGVIFLVNTSNIWAAMSLTFSGLPSSVNGDDSFNVNVSLIDAPTETNYYLRAAFYKTGTTSYFGYTWNHFNEWHNAPGEPTKFLEITTSIEGSWSGQLKTKADLDSSYFKGGGEYQFKIGRYISSGNFGSWSSNIGTITINYTSPSPTPTPSPSPSPESDPEPTPSPSPSPTPKVSVKPTTTKKPAVVSNSNSHNSEDMLSSSESGRILGIEKPEAFEATESEKGKNPYLLSIILVILGLGLLGGTGVVFIKNAKYNKKHEKDGKI